MSAENTAEVRNIDEARTKYGDKAPVTQAPAIGTSITMNLGGEAQMVLQGFFAADASDAEANALVDRMFKVARRQKAVYDLVTYTDELETLEKTRARFEEDFEKTEERFATDKAKLEVEAATLQMSADEAQRAGYEQHRASGKRGEYAPVGHTAAKIARAKEGIAQVKTNIEKAENERAQYIETILKSRERFLEDIAARKRKIAQAHELLGTKEG